MLFNPWRPRSRLILLHSNLTALLGVHVSEGQWRARTWSWTVLGFQENWEVVGLWVCSCILRQVAVDALELASFGLCLTGKRVLVLDLLMRILAQLTITEKK